MAKQEKDSRMNFLRRTAKEVREYKVRMKILKIILVMLVIVTSIVYVTAALYKNTGSFTVSLNKVDMNKYGLSLSESREMLYKTSHLNASIVEEMTNIDGNIDIPKNVDMQDGVHNGDDYIAYTFYLQNSGENEVSYEYNVGISNIINTLDEAIRIRLYVDGKATTYAKTRKDGTGPEPGTKEFYSVVSAANQRIEGFAPGDMTRFTVVIWIEGNDPECLDYLLGGVLRVDMDFRIVH